MLIKYLFSMINKNAIGKIIHLHDQRVRNKGYIELTRKTGSEGVQIGSSMAKGLAFLI